MPKLRLEWSPRTITAQDLARAFDFYLEVCLPSPSRWPKGLRRAYEVHETHHRKGMSEGKDVSRWAMQGMKANARVAVYRWLEEVAERAEKGEALNEIFSDLLGRWEPEPIDG